MLGGGWGEKNRDYYRQPSHYRDLLDLRFGLYGDGIWIAFDLKEISPLIVFVVGRINFHVSMILL